jgi:hypothetical protein
MRTIAAAAIVVTVLATTGCTTAVSSIPSDFPSAAEERSVVVGRVELVWAKNGEGLWNAPAPALNFLRGDRLRIKAKNERTGRTFNVAALDKGPSSDFNVVLPYGRYRVEEVWTDALKTPLKATFEVPRSAAVYIGTFRFSGYQPSFAQRLLTMTMARGRWYVVNNADEVIQRFRERHPQLTPPVMQALATFGTPTTLTPQATAAD